MDNRNYVVYTRKKNTNQNKFKKTLRDYAAPLVVLAIILCALFYFIFAKDSDENKDPASNSGSVSQVIKSGISVTPEDGAVVYEIGKNSKKIQISGKTEVSNGTSIEIESRELTSKVETKNGIFRLNGLGELTINNNGNLKLNSSDLWGVTKKDLEVEMSYANLEIYRGTVFSLTQNEAASSIYVIKGTIKVSNLVKANTLLGDNQKISILGKNKDNKSIDLSTEKDNIDNFFLEGAWYNKNKEDLMGDDIINSLLDEDANGNGDSQENSTGKTTNNNSSSTNRVGKGILELNDLRDEMVVSSTTVKVSGAYYSDFVSRITLDGKDATIDLQNKTFNFGNIELTSRETNLIIKSFDSEGNVISKDIYTLYYNGDFPKKEEPKNDTTSNSNDNSNNNNSSNNSNAVAVTPSQFVFTAPGATPYTTSEDFVTIRGTVPNGVVQKITVNGYTLQQYVEYSDNWRYHASTEYGNLQNGTNVYEVKYFGEGGSLVYTNSFTIVKQ